MINRHIIKIHILLVSISTLMIVGASTSIADQGNVVAGEEFVQEVSVDSDSMFVYSSKGRRDPFKPLVQEKHDVVSKASGRSVKIKGPLEQFELSQYRLVAMMVVKGNPRAMVKGPDGKGYTVTVGEYIGLNDGIVRNIETKAVGVDENGMRIEISPDRIVVEEIGIDTMTGKEVSENLYIVM